MKCWRLSLEIGFWFKCESAANKFTSQRIFQHGGEIYSFAFLLRENRCHSHVCALKMKPEPAGGLLILSYNIGNTSSKTLSKCKNLPTNIPKAVQQQAVPG